MQTFLPYEDFRLSAKALDYKRLGKQRVECKQLLESLGFTVRDGQLWPSPATAGRGWANHPAAKMWRGYEPALAEYQADCIREWCARGYKNSMERVIWDDDYDLQYPPWLGDEAFHASHRSNLLRKDEAFYRQHGWTEPTNLPYVWPVS